MSADPAEKIWYYAANGQQVGPFSVDEMHAHLASGTLAGATPCWKNGMADWQAAESIPELTPPAKSTSTIGTPVEPISPEEAAASLKLGGGGRKFDKVNLKDEDPTGGVDVTDFLAASKDKQPESKLLTKPKVGFFESFGLGCFEAAFFAVTLVLGGIACLVAMDYWHAILMGLGLLWMVTAGFALMVRAFIKHWAWGLAYIFVPFAALVYVIVDIKNAGKSLLLWLVGVGVFFAVPELPGFEDSPLFEVVNQYQQLLQEEIEKQQQEMEQQRNQDLDQFNQ